MLDEETNRQAWKAWQLGLSGRITLSEKLPPLRMLLIWDNLAGSLHARNGFMAVCAWRNATLHPIRRLLVEYGRVHSTHFGPQSHLLGKTQKRQNRSLLGWRQWHGPGTKTNPFEWGGARAARRERSRNRRHALGGSGACARRSYRPNQSDSEMASLMPTDPLVGREEATRERHEGGRAMKSKKIGTR